MPFILVVFLIFFSVDGFSIGSPESGYIVPAGTSVRVNAHGVCRKVINGHGSYHYFFSAKTSPEWGSFVGNTPSGVSLTACDGTYTSCLDHLRANPAATSGVYSIDPDGASGNPPIDAYCDMTTDGGGWTLVWSNTRSGSNKPTTNMNWTSATTTTPLCSEAQGSGTGCGSYLGNNKEGFNYYIGMDWWYRIAGNNKNNQMMYLWSSDYGQPIEQGAKFNLKRSNSSKLYTSKNTNYSVLFGAAANAGLYGYMDFPFSTYEVDNDYHLTHCAAVYSGTPFWYFNCWDGNINGGGENTSDGYYNGAYWRSSAKMWGDPSGIGAGNGWLYVREYDYLANCTEIKSKFPGAPSGLYMIDPDGMNGNAPLLAQCDMTTDGGGWTLVFNHKSNTGGFFADATEAAEYNVAKPQADRYSILSKLEGFRSLKGNFTFRINDPVSGIRNIWQQRTNPAVNQAVAGYVPLSIDTTADSWAGLERNCSVGCSSSFIDGSIGISDWWYALGSYNFYAPLGIPGLANTTANQMQLWTRDDSFLLNSPRDCQDILEYGQSQGDGLYWVDPTSSGSSMQVYCDMTSDGGGWTRVFIHDMLGGLYSGPAEALSTNIAVPTAYHYSILNQLDDFKANGRYVFKLSWPGNAIRNIWSQTTNPTIDQPVAGYVPLVIDSNVDNWGGLERYCAVGCSASFIDGSIGTGNFWHAIGVFVDWQSMSIPSSPLLGPNGSQRAELWTRRAEGQYTKRSCKEILSAGLSTGNGFYLIDPDGVGGLVPFRVYCDMTTNGGGWTRVAFSDGTASTTSVADDFFVNQYRMDHIGNVFANTSGSVNTEWFSRLIGTTDAMLKAPAYPNSPYIDVGLGAWEYDTARCTGTLRHSSRTAGCAGQDANDDYSSADGLNIAVEDGDEGIVPNWGNTGNYLCYNGHGDCSFEFFLR